MSDLVSYGLLASIFILTGLRMLIEKPNKLREAQLARPKRTVGESTES